MRQCCRGRVELCLFVLSNVAMPIPIDLKSESPDVADAVAKVAKARQRAQLSATAIGIIGLCMLLCAAVMKTTPAGCTYGVTRYFEVNPNIIVASGDPIGLEVKRVGGVRQTIRALQIALDMPLVDVAPDAPADGGQWWAIANSSREVVDTEYNDLEKGGTFLVVEPGSNQTRLIVMGADLCSPESSIIPEPSISTDSDWANNRVRLWKRCLPPLPTMTDAQIAAYIGAPETRFDTFSTASVKVVSSKQRAFKSTASIVRLFPELRETVTRTSQADLPVKPVAKAVLSSCVLYNGFIAAQVNVMMSRPADPILEPSAVLNIFVTLDPRVRGTNDVRDAAMRRASHHAQQILGRAVINFEASQRVDPRTIALLTQ